MKSESIRAKLARSLDPTKEINVVCCGYGSEHYPEFQALGVVRRAYRRLKKVEFYDLFVEAKPAEQRWEERTPHVLGEFRYETKKLDRSKDPEAQYRSLYERATQRLRERYDTRDGTQLVAFILTSNDANRIFSKIDGWLINSIHNEYSEKNPDIRYHVSFRHTFRTATHSRGYDGIFCESRPPHEFGPNTVFCYSGGRDVKMACFPASIKKVAYVEIRDYDGDVLSLGQLIDQDLYERFLWAPEAERTRVVIYHTMGRAGNDRPNELLYGVLKCLVEYPEQLSEKQFVVTHTKGLGDFMHDLSVPELIDELSGNPGLFKVVREWFNVREGKPVERYRSVLDEISDTLQAFARQAFEEGDFDQYTDVCVPGVKRDLTFSFCVTHEKSVYTISFTHQVE